MDQRRRDLLATLFWGASFALLPFASPLSSVTVALAKDDDGSDDGDDDESENENENEDEAEDRERDRISRSVEKGELMSLAALRRIVLQRFKGEILSIKLSRGLFRTTYRFRILQGNGRVIETEINAATGKILEVKNK